MKKTARSKTKETKTVALNHNLETRYQFFVRFPPKHIQWSEESYEENRLPTLDLAVDLSRGLDEEKYASAAMLAELYEYRQTKNPLALMKVFSFAVNVGVYPPTEVLQSLSTMFEQYGKDKTSLEKAFGLKKKKGDWSAEAKQKQRAQTRLAALLMQHEINTCGISHEEAAARVEGRLQKMKAFTGIAYTAESLIRQYPKWKQTFGLGAPSLPSLYSEE